MAGRYGFGVALKYRRGASLDQDLLLPVSMREWLPGDHLVFFVLDIVNELDLSEFSKNRRSDGLGGASYAPAMMMALLCYAYMCGELSSRKIEKRVHEDVAFRIAAGGLFPDHATLCRWRAGHAEAFTGLFRQVLGLCDRAGLVDMSVLAVDGTKIAANASLSASKTAERLAELLVGEAVRVDAAEDAALPEVDPPEAGDRDLRRPGASRPERIRRALADLEAEKAAVKPATEDRAAHREAMPGRPATEHPGKPRSRANITDPDSRVMHTKEGYRQCYNAQVAVTASQVIVAAVVAQEPTDVCLLGPVARRALECYRQATGRDPGTPVVLADAGYYSAANAALEGFEPLIASGTRLDTTSEKLADKAATGKLVDDVLTRYENREIDGEQAAKELGITVLGVRSRAYRRQKRRRNAEQPDGRKLQQMNERMATEAGLALYKKRAGMVEPVFAQLKHNRGITRFPRRGHPAAQTELTLWALTANLLKVFHSQPAVT